MAPSTVGCIRGRMRTRLSGHIHIYMLFLFCLVLFLFFVFLFLKQKGKITIMSLFKGLKNPLCPCFKYRASQWLWFIGYGLGSWFALFCFSFFWCDYFWTQITCPENGVQMVSSQLKNTTSLKSLQNRSCLFIFFVFIIFFKWCVKILLVGYYFLDR